jgi:hypothetical protein
MKPGREPAFGRALDHHRRALGADGLGAFPPALGGAELGAGALHGEALEPVAVLDAQLQAGGPAQGHSGVVELLAGGDRVNKFDDGVRQVRDAERFGGCGRDTVSGQVPGDDVEVVAQERADLAPQHRGGAERRPDDQERFVPQRALGGKQHCLHCWFSHGNLRFRLVRLK